jgi:hypothetical protein
MPQSALILNTDKLMYPVTQVGHGFAPGHVIRYDVGLPGFVLAQADSEANCAGSVQVSYVQDVDNFYYTQVGTTYGLTSQVFVDGDTYWLSPTTPGLLTNVKPTAIGQVELECFVATGTDKGLFWGGSGQLIQSGSLFQWNFILAPGNFTGASNNGYILADAGAISMTLPAAPSVGDTIKVSTLIAPASFVVDYPAGGSITLVEAVSTITTGDVTLDLTNGVRSAQATFTFQTLGNWRMIADGNWIVN